MGIQTQLRREEKTRGEEERRWEKTSREEERRNQLLRVEKQPLSLGKCSCQCRDYSEIN